MRLDGRSLARDESWWQRFWTRGPGTGLRDTLWVCAGLWALPIIILFLGWGIGSGNVETGQSYDLGPSQSAHALAGSTIEWIGVALIIPVGAATILILARTVRNRRRP
jgi:hypothetical protein